MTASDARLAEIQARVDAATPGPWVADGIEVWTEGETVAGGTIHTTDDGYPRGDYHPVEDADLIANAPADLAYLLAQLSAAHADGWDECLDAIEQNELNTEQAREGNPYRS